MSQYLQLDASAAALVTGRTCLAYMVHLVIRQLHTHSAAQHGTAQNSTAHSKAVWLSAVVVRSMGGKAPRN